MLQISTIHFQCASRLCRLIVAVTTALCYTLHLRKFFFTCSGYNRFYDYANCYMPQFVSESWSGHHRYNFARVKRYGAFFCAKAVSTAISHGCQVICKHVLIYDILSLSELVQDGRVS